MRTGIRIIQYGMLLTSLTLCAACASYDGIEEEEFQTSDGSGVFILCEGNYQSGNSTLSYYDTESQEVENAVFYRANDRRLGDTGQSITIQDSTAYIAVENSGIVWAINTNTFRVTGQLTTGDTEHMINPRFVLPISRTKAYITDLYSPYITIFNPQTMQATGSISTGQPSAYGYCSTEQIVQWGSEAFTNCWCYSRSILVIDTDQDIVTDSIVLPTSWQPKRMVLDTQGKLWVITDGGYATSTESVYDNVPHLYRIDASTHEIEADWSLDTDEASVELALDPTGTYLYIVNNDIYRMELSDSHPPVRPFIEAPTDDDGTRHKLYGIGVDPASGDIYVADAVDYSQSGVVYRYASTGDLLDSFRVGINPNGFAFK